MKRNKLAVLVMLVGVTVLGSSIAMRDAEGVEAPAPLTCANTGCHGADTDCYYEPGCICFLKNGKCDGENDCGAS